MAKENHKKIIGRSIKLIPFFFFLFLSACSSDTEDAVTLIDLYYQSDQDIEIFQNILNLAKTGNLVAVDSVSREYGYNDSLNADMQQQVIEVLAENEGPITDFSLALAALNHTLPDAEVDFEKVFDLVVSSLDECRYFFHDPHPLFWPPTINGAKFMLLGSNGQGETNRLLTKIERCADHYWDLQWLRRDLDWEIDKNPAGRLAQIEELKALWTWNKRNGWAANLPREITNDELITELRPTTPTSEIYIKNVFHFPNLDSLAEVVAQLEEDAIAGDIKAARSLGIYYSGQLLILDLSRDFSIDSSKTNKARNWLSIAAESDPVAKFYLWALDYGQRDQEANPQASRLLADSLRGGFYVPACMALTNYPEIADEIEVAFSAYSEEEVVSALLFVCEEGLFNQLQLLENEVSQFDSASQSTYDYSSDFPLLMAFPGFPAVTMGTDAEGSVFARGIAAVVVGLLFLYLSFLTFDANPSNTKNKAIALILALEGYILLSLVGLSLLPVTLESLSVGRFILTLLPIAAFILPLGYVLFLSTSDTHLGRPCRTPLVRVGIPSLICVWVLYMQWKWDVLVHPIFGPDFISFNVQPSFIGAFALILLVFHLIILGNLAYQYFFEKRNNKDSAETQFYLAAYLSRFTFIAFTFVSIANAMFLGSGMNISQQNLVSITFIIGEMIYGILFSYGILRAELFGVKRLIKRGLVKLSLACLLFGAYYLTESFVSENFSDLLGNMAGLISAAVVFAFERPISRRAYQFIDILIPDENDASDSEEIYTYLYELAIDDGVISSNEKRMLDVTAEKLNLSENQVREIEISSRK